MSLPRTPPVSADAPVRAGPPVDVAVVGGGVAGLVAARAAATAGRSVVVLESAAALGGLIGVRRVAGIDLDAGAESFATRGGTVQALLTELGLGGDVVAPVSAPARVHHDGRSYPLPATGVLGVPTDLDLPGLAEVLGADGLAAARRDLSLPAHVGAGEHTLAGLVAARMGRAVVDALLRPVVRGVHSVEPEEIAADALLPGLRDRIARVGSLSGALRELRATAPAGNAVLGVSGGMHRMVDTLAADLGPRGVRMRTTAPVRTAVPIRLAAGAGPGWLLHTPAGAMTARSLLLACAPHTWDFLRAPAGDTTSAAVADHPEGVATVARLGRDWPAPSSVDLVTLVLDAAAVPEHHRAGVLVARPGRGAKALTYLTAKWAWVARVAGPGRDVIRLSYAAGIVPPEAEQQAEIAVRDAGRLLGIDLPRTALIGHARTRLTMPRPVLAEGMPERVAAMRAAVAATAGLEVAGTWIAGTGLASVIPDAGAAGGRAARR